MSKRRVQSSDSVVRIENVWYVWYCCWCWCRCYCLFIGHLWRSSRHLYQLFKRIHSLWFVADAIRLWSNFIYKILFDSLSWHYHTSRNWVYSVAWHGMACGGGPPTATAKTIRIRNSIAFQIPFHLNSSCRYLAHTRTHNSYWNLKAMVLGKRLQYNLGFWIYDQIFYGYKMAFRNGFFVWNR